MSSEYKLTTAFPYLLNRVGVRMGELFSRRLEPYGLTLSTYRVLAAIWERGPQSLGTLADIASIEVSTLSRQVGALVEVGLLSRRRPSSNGRVVEIDLTSDGRALVERLIPVAQIHEDVGLRGFNSGAIAALKRDLARVYANLDALDTDTLRSGLLPCEPEHSGVNDEHNSGGLARAGSSRRRRRT